MTQRVLAIDIGTHSTRAAVVNNAAGEVELIASQSIDLQRLDASRVEQDPREIVAATRSVIERVMERAVTQAIVPDVVSLAIQRSTVVAWKRSDGTVLSPALSWQDTRASSLVDEMHPHRDEIKMRSGLVLSPHYGASKLHWLLANVAEGYDSSEVCLGPLASFVLFHLLEGHPCICDESNASRTQLWNLRDRVWDSRLCELFAVPPAYLPKVQPIQSNYGVVNAKGYSLPLKAVCGDQNAAFFAFSRASQPAGSVNDHLWALVNAGTGAFILSPFKGVVKDAGQLLVAPFRSSEFGSPTDLDLLVEGTVNGAGSALSWCYNHYHPQSLTLEQFYQALPGWLQAEPSPPIFINTIGGLGSPWWRTHVRAHFLMADGTRAESLDFSQRAVATLESIVFLVQSNIVAMQQLSGKLNFVWLTGGVGKLDGFCQKLADVSGLQVLRPNETEATLLGAAALVAGTDSDQRQNLEHDEFTPRPNTSLRARFDLFTGHLNRQAKAAPGSTESH